MKKKGQSAEGSFFPSSFFPTPIHEGCLSLLGATIPPEKEGRRWMVFLLLYLRPIISPSHFSQPSSMRLFFVRNRERFPIFSHIKYEEKIKRKMKFLIFLTFAIFESVLSCKLSEFQCSRTSQCIRSDKW